MIELVKSPAREVAGNGITVNAVCPTGVDTTMIQAHHITGETLAVAAGQNSTNAG